MSALLVAVLLSVAPSLEPLPVIDLPRSAGPMATVKLAFRAGSVDDPSEHAGLTALAADLVLRGGTGALPDEKLQEALDVRGASIEVQTDREQTVYTARAPAPFIAEVSGWLAEEVAHPRVDAEAFDVARAEALEALIHGLRENPEALAAEALMPLLFPGHPYGRPAGGTVAGLEAATLDDARAQLLKLFARDRLTLGLAGDYPPELARSLDASLAGLPSHGAPLPALLPPGNGPRALLIQHDASATTLFLGMAWDVRRGDPDFVPLAVAVSALGEHRQFGGRLFGELRNLRGLNYGDYAYVERFVQDGTSTFPAPHVALRQQYFSLWVRPVDAANRVFALRAAVHVVREMVERGITDEELTRTKGFLAGATRTWAQTDERALGWAIDGAFYGDPDFLAHYRAALESVTAAQVNAALKRHLDAGKLRFAIVGPDVRELAKALGSGKASPPHYAGARPSQVESADKEIATVDLGLKPGDIEVVRAGDLFLR